MARERKQPVKEGPRLEYPEPDKLPVTKRQAAYLSNLTGIASEKLAGKTHSALEDILRFKIDPELLFYRRVCGQVVRKEPVTGVLQGVPNATVHVEDTDCSFLGIFPWEGPWSWWWWFWPIFCNREEIATTMTDECGKFCVWIPRWDIDRILWFRKQRICFPEIYRPTIRDVLDEIRIPIKKPPFPDPPNPPDPPPFDLLDREVLAQVGERLGGRSLDKLTQFAERRSFGRQTGELTALLDEPAFIDTFPPPLNDDKLKQLEKLDLKERLSERFEKAKLDLAELSPIKAIGPFLRCRDVYVAEWEYFSDVPDVTFRVTQDVDLDGDEELIYSEGFFDVRWNAGPIPPVTLQAAPIAKPSPICERPIIVCGNKPAIVTVGVMPLAATHHTNATGHSNRVNRPRPGGLFTDAPVGPAQAPYAGTLQLHGCHHIAGAAYYRLLYSFNGAAEVPFLGLEWYPPKLTGPPWWYHAVPDALGWYEVLPAAQLVFPNWLLNWPTTSGPNGKYDVRLELADGSKNPLAAPAQYSDKVLFSIDNSQPLAGFTQIRWRTLGGSYLPQNTYTWPFVCIVIKRPTATDIQVEVQWSASSALHLRSARLTAGGCGAGNPTLAGASSIADTERWHVDFMDNSVSKTALYDLDGSLPQGSYSFSIDAYSRAFNPAGDGGGPGINWLDDYSYIHANPSVALSVIDN